MHISIGSTEKDNTDDANEGVTCYTYDGTTETYLLYTIHHEP